MEENLKKWRNLEFQWNHLTYEDIEELLEIIIRELKGMEMKNNWDLCVNNDDLPIFINQAFTYMSAILDPLEFEEWQQYPKQKDFYSLWNIINEEVNRRHPHQDGGGHRLLHRQGHLPPGRPVRQADGGAGGKAPLAILARLSVPKTERGHRPGLSPGCGPCDPRHRHWRTGDPQRPLHHLPPAHGTVPHGGGVRDAPGLSGGGCHPAAGQGKTERGRMYVDPGRALLGRGRGDPVGEPGGGDAGSAPGGSAAGPGAGQLHGTGLRPGGAADMEPLFRRPCGAAAVLRGGGGPPAEL